MRWIEGDTLPEKAAPKLSSKEKYLKQVQENYRQSDENWNYVQANEDRYAAHRADVISRRSPSQMLDDSFRDTMASQCSLEDEMAKNHQQVLIADLEDAHKILHNAWIDAGRDVASIASSIAVAKSWYNNVEPYFDARSIVKQFGDVGIKAEIMQSKGKSFVAFSGAKNGKEFKHALVNGTRIKMAGKKYPLDSFKAAQIGFSPKSRAANFKGAGVATFFVSAGIATTELVFNNDYHLVDWFGHVGSDMFKALVQYGAGEAMLLATASFGTAILAGALFVVAAYVLVEIVWSEYEISNQIVRLLENATQN
ncbi:hypothetical protein [Vibrio furnissii]|uniref:hypothetical protein n=1 Tax=Vibrio furnissii TaxID=29494 RepID=UPI001559D711|nr:hypothetical protein [Vibrio furnissii]